LTVALVVLIGHLVYGVEWPREPLTLLLFTGLGVVSFASLGIAFAQAIPNVDSAPAYSNAIFLPVIFISGVFYSSNDLPPVLKGVAEALPLKHVIDGLSAGIVGSSVDTGVAALVVGGWALAVGGLVEQPLHLSLTDLQRLPQLTQVTKHVCIQGWSAIAAWTGVPLRSLLALCRPLPEARYLVFHALDDKATSEVDSGGTGCYYETVDLELARHPQTLLAYAMNERPLPLEHGAPLRLRVEDAIGLQDGQVAARHRARRRLRRHWGRARRLARGQPAL